MANPPGASVLHGTRSCYVQGCRCNACRSANSAYFQLRRKIGYHRVAEESVDASRAREYLNYLSEIGIGRASVHNACGVRTQIISEIASGLKTRISRSTQARILGIKPNEAMPRGAYVDAEITRQQIQALLGEGFTKSDLANRLHRFSDRLYIGEGRKGKVRVSSALKVNTLYRLMMAENERNENFLDAA